MNAVFKVYIIQSLKDGSFYIGYSSNIEERVKKHNEGNSRYTSKKTPWKLVYTEEFSSKSDAIKREKWIKIKSCVYANLLVDLNRKYLVRSFLQPEQ